MKNVKEKARKVILTNIVRREREKEKEIMKIKRRKSKKKDNFEESTHVGLEKRIKRKNRRLHKNKIDK